jgi:hypothetical protein
MYQKCRYILFFMYRPERQNSTLTVLRKHETTKHEEIRETIRMGCLEDKGKGDKEEATHVYYN